MARIIKTMSERVIHISEAEAANNFSSLLAHVRAGAEVIIEQDREPIAIVRPAAPVGRTIDEALALLPVDSTAVIDPDFAKDVEAAVGSHREPLDPPTWE
jgi:antitoxin (DNA-binding transcriptional repressor) of toxin-antitoxin stability system